ncbi:hypothetical protein SFUMM280S_00445 [Streptomyces fumanus]
MEELRTAFNAMLEHIDDSLAVRAEAERRLRRFVADASHELRTPLMSVRGYADLFQYAAANEPGERRTAGAGLLLVRRARMGVPWIDLLAGSPGRRRGRGAAAADRHRSTRAGARQGGDSCPAPPTRGAR